MLTYNSETTQFRNDQQIVRRATYWDTAMSVAKQGIGYAAFSVVQPNGLNFLNLTHTQLEALLNDKAKVRSVLDYSTGAYRTGVVPNVYSFWGGGSPPGVSTPKRALLKYFGTVQESGIATLVLGGHGRVRVYKNGVEHQSGVLTEPKPRPQLERDTDRTTTDLFRTEAGYLISELTVNAGDEIEIYYLHNGETWGGIFAKMIPQDVPSNTWYDFTRALQDAPVLSSSLISVGNVGAGVEVPYLISGALDNRVKSIPTAVLTVSLAGTDSPNGFRLRETQDQYWLEDNQNPALTIKVGRRVQFEGGYLKRGGVEETYQRFTGHIVDVYPGADRETAVIECEGISAMMKGEFNENYPDRLSYHSNGFIHREWHGEPVWGVPAADAWPLEVILADLCYRSGIDSANLGKSPFSGDPAYGRKEHITATSLETVLGSRLFSAVTLAGDEKIHLPRNKNYGNVGVLRKEYLPVDDDYLFSPELTDELFDRAQELADLYGYDFGFDAQGRAFIGARDNPSSFSYDVISEVGFESVHPNAIGGLLFEKKESENVGAWTKTLEGDFSRLVLYAGVGKDSTSGLNGGKFNSAVEVWDGLAWVSLPEESRTFTTFAEDLSETFFYDGVIRPDGSNVAEFTLLNLPFDRYRVTLTSAGLDPADVNLDCLYRLNGVSFYQTNPLASSYPAKISTLGNVLSLSPKSERKELRNTVIVVGARQAIITDSEKVGSAEASGNASYEHFISVATDVDSIYSPESGNYAGGKKVALIIDDSIADGDFARWMAKSTLYRYRSPRTSASLSHTAIPIMELRDAVNVVEEKHQSISDVLWVEGFKETWGVDKAEVSIQTTSFREAPSYQPREDISIDDLFVPADPYVAGEGLPVINMRLGYRNIYGSWVDNAVLGSPNLLLDGPEQGSQVAVSTPTEVYLDLPGTVGNYASTPDSAALDITGDIDLRARHGLASISSGSNQTLIHRVDGTDAAYSLSFGATGRLILRWTDSGGVVKLMESSAAPTQPYVRGVLDVDNGLSEHTVTFYESADGVTWTTVGLVLTGTGVTSIRVGTGELRVGATGADTSLASGKLYSAEVRNGIDGPLVADFDPSLSEKPHTTFVASTGETWTINRSGDPSADIVEVGQMLPANLIPESLYLLHTAGKRALVNHPYRHFWNIDGWSLSHEPTVSWDFQEGDGTAGVYDESYYNFPTDYTVNYKTLRAGRTAAENPFYDPYSSELGHLMEVSFDALVAGFYRVSVWAADRDSNPVPVAWLTEPTGDALEPEAHWTYYDPGKEKALLWDGVDNIGAWNREMSEEYARAVEGTFGEGAPTAVGKGFYAWNDLKAGGGEFWSQIGDPVTENFSPQSNDPYFTLGKYSKFYVRVDVMSDRILRETMRSEPRTTRSDDLRGVAEGWNSHGEVCLYTHLGEPNQVEVEVWDYDAADWSQAGGGIGNWIKLTADGSDGTNPDAAEIHNKKPVKFRFNPRARRGPLWDNENDITVKLTRQAHLKYTVFDTFLTLFGRAWDDLEDLSTGAEEKRVTNRMFHNDEHTIQWPDETWRTGESLKAMEWVFTPEMFEKDFGAGFEEALRFGDYEQLVALPGHNPQKAGGASTGEQAYFILGFINYLFYFSAFTLDRSGRRQWCLNPKFIDKSKIVSPTWLDAQTTNATTTDGAGNTLDEPTYRPEYAIDFERNGADRYLARSIFVRQWAAPYWTDGTDSRSPANKYAITDAYQVKWIQPWVHQFEPTDPTLNGSLTEDSWIAAYQTKGSWANRDIRNSLRTDDPTYPTTNPRDFCLKNSLGRWSFTRAGLEDLFWPSPKRDYHPYWRLPLMPDWAGSDPEKYTGTNSLSCLAAPVSNVHYRGRDIAGQDRWYGISFAEAGVNAHANKGARLEYSAREWFVNNEDNRISWDTSYDYEKVDELARFDQFRGVWSRSSWANRDSKDTHYDWGLVHRGASRQPIAPAGAYLLNVGNYTDYTTARQMLQRDQVIHFTEHCGSLFDVRFRHEYVWQSKDYFKTHPYKQRQGSLYMLHRDEFTGASEALKGKESYEVLSPAYDAGAWAGWKDDAKRHQGTAIHDDTVECAHWAEDPFLRWRDHDVEFQLVWGGTPVNVAHRSGGFGPTEAVGGWAATGEDSQDQKWHDIVFSYQRANILDEGDARGFWSGTEDELRQGAWFCNQMRLAVGPRVPESRNLKMSLVTPERLTGETF